MERTSLPRNYLKCERDIYTKRNHPTPLFQKKRGVQPHKEVSIIALLIVCRILTYTHQTMFSLVRGKSALSIISMSSVASPSTSVSYQTRDG